MSRARRKPWMHYLQNEGESNAFCGRQDIAIADTSTEVDHVNCTDCLRALVKALSRRHI